MRVLYYAFILLILLSCEKTDENEKRKSVGHLAEDLEKGKISFLSDFLNSEAALLTSEKGKHELESFLRSNNLKQSMSESIEFLGLFPDGNLLDTWGNHYVLLNQGDKFVIISIGENQILDSIVREGFLEINGDDLTSLSSE